MKEINKDKIISIATLLLSALLAVITKDLSPLLRFITVGVIVLFALCYFIYSILSAIKIRNSISSTAIIAKSKKYINYLYKLCKANEKNLKKHAAANELKTIEKLNNKIVRKLTGKKVDLNSKNKQLKNLENKLNIKISSYRNLKAEKYQLLREDKLIIKFAKKLNGEQNLRISKEIIAGIRDLNRILLQIDKHKLRIKFGQYVVKYTDDEFIQLEAYIDYIGWTNILTGHINKGYKSIMIAIGLIDERIGEGESIPKNMSTEDYCQYLFLKARAYRHLGTTYYTYTSKQIDPIKYLNKALEVVNNNIFINEYREKNDQCQNKYKKLKLGIENNLLLAKYYFLKKSLNNKSINLNNYSLDSIIEEINQKINETNNMKKIDKHRLIKLLVLKNQILMNYKDNRFLNEEELVNNFKTIQHIFEDNINFDDAMEVFIKQKVQFVYNDVLKIIMEKED